MDIVRKATQIRTAARPMRRHILCNDALKTKDKLLLADSLIFSKGLFAASAWPRLSAVELRIIHAATMVVFRSIAKEEIWETKRSK
jgi:hypothetical protein